MVLERRPIAAASPAPSRREAIRSVLALPLSGVFGLASGETMAQTRGSDTNILVAYFTRTGNTRVIAGQIQRALGTDLFEIVPRDPYPEDYEETVAQAQRERERAYEPPLTANVRDIGRYETIFLGLPIWGTTVPPAVQSFLSAHDLSARTLVPFVTHGGYGAGDALTIIRGKAPRAQVLDAFVMEADQERRTLERVTGWLDRAGISPT